MSLIGDKCPVPIQRHDSWDTRCPHEPRIGADPFGNKHGKACGSTARDSLGQLAWSSGFWGGALRCVGLLACSSLAYADINAVAARSQFMQLCLQDVGLCACAGQHALCSFGLNSSQATNCLSIGKFLDLEFRKFENTQQEWKGTIAHHFDLQIFNENKHAIVDANWVYICHLPTHKFDQHITSNFGSLPQISDRMALAEQVRRVAQAENYALPRAWRGRNRSVGNLVPRILERPAAKARLNPPVPSRSPGLDIVRAVVQEVEEAPTPPEPVEIVELLEDDPGTQEQQVHLVSVGVRWTDLQQIDDPGRDRSLQSHLGYHPDTVSRLISNMEFMQPFFDALFEALQHPQSTIRFTCASGRHRSVVAVHLAQAVLRGIVSHSNISIQHASRSHWGRLCNLQCAECYNFVHHPPALYMRAVADIREDLLQALRGYMDRCRACMLVARAVRCQELQACSPYQACTACAGTISNTSTSPSTCAMQKIKRFGISCAAISSFLQNTTQQISVLQPSQCATTGWTVFLLSPFLNKDKNWTRSCIAIITFFRNPHPHPSLGSRTTCPLRKYDLDRSSYWGKVFKSFFTWSLLHNESCYNVEGSKCPLMDRLGFSQHKHCPLAPTNECRRLIQPRRAQLGAAIADQDGYECGNCGIFRGHTKRFGFLCSLGKGMNFSCVALTLQQVGELCMSTFRKAVHAFLCPDVNALCQPVVLKMSSPVKCNNLRPLYIKDSKIRNGLGSCSILCSQPLKDFTHQQIQFTCKFEHNTLCSKHYHSQLVGKQEFQQRSISVGVLCLGLQLAMSAERLSEALQRVAKAKISPSLPKALAARQGGPIAPKLIALRCPPKPPPGRITRSLEDTSEEPPVAKDSPQQR